jgi:hypothetical protein
MATKTQFTPGAAAAAADEVIELELFSVMSDGPKRN